MQQWSASVLRTKLGRIRAMLHVSREETREERRRAARALTLLAGVRVCSELHVVGREEPDLPADLAFPPVRVLLAEDVDDLTFAEGQLVVVLGRIVIHPNHLAHCKDMAG